MWRLLWFKHQYSRWDIAKIINYRKKIAIVGEFSIYTSKRLKDFIYECNKGKDVFFISDVEQTIKRLSIEWLKGRDLIGSL